VAHCGAGGGTERRGAKSEASLGVRFTGLSQSRNFSNIGVLFKRGTWNPDEARHQSWIKQDVRSSFAGLDLLSHRSMIDLKENPMRQLW